MRARVVVIAGVAAALAAPIALSASRNMDFFDAVINIFFVAPIFFIMGLWAGIPAGWDALAAATEILSVIPFAEPVIVGVISGLAVAILQRLRWLPSPKWTDAVVSSLSSRAFWTASMVDRVGLFALNLTVAYVVSTIFVLSGALDSGSPDWLGQLNHVVTTVTGGGAGGGGLGSDLDIFSFLLAIIYFAGVVMAFGAVIGFFSAAPIGAIVGALTWTAVAQGAAEGATSRAFGPSSVKKNGVLMESLAGAFQGGLSGAMSGAIAALVIGAVSLVTAG
jgi:hypothetical protein